MFQQHIFHQICQNNLCHQAIENMSFYLAFINLNKSLIFLVLLIPGLSSTPDDISITGLRFKRSKLIIKGIALTFEDRKDFEIIDEYVQMLRKNKEFSNNFNRIKYVGHSKVNIRGQEIVRFEIEAAIKKTKRKSFS